MYTAPNRHHRSFPNQPSPYRDRPRFRPIWHMETRPLRPKYTHHSPTGATRIDRIYISNELMARKAGIEIIPAVFTDHHAVVLSLTIQDHVVSRRRGRWRLDPNLMHDENFKGKIGDEWVEGRKSKHYCSDVVMWWERPTKQQLQRFIRLEERKRHRNHRHMEKHLYECH